MAGVTGWWAERFATPSPAALALIGGTPIVNVTSDSLITPKGAVLALTGGRPALETALAPTPAALAIIGGTPAIQLAQRITPAPASLAIVGGQPALGTALRPSAAALAIIGGQPTVTNTQPVTYSAVGAGASSTAIGSATFNFTAVNGADVFVVVTSDRNVSNTGATYGGVAMTQIASVSHNNAAASGTTKVYRLAGAGDGTAKAVLAQGSGTAWWIVNAISWTGVSAVGTVATATGSSTSPSQPVSGVGLQVFTDANGGGSRGTISAFSGVTNRANLAPSGAAQAISTAAAAGTASATLSTATPWAAIFIPLS
jgi:hypothetical protein